MSETSKGRTNHSIFINARLVKYKKKLASANLPFLSYRLPRSPSFRSRYFALCGRYQDLHIHSQRRYRDYIPRLLQSLFTCAPLPSIERNDVKKEQVPRFVLINWSTCAPARSFQRAALDIGRTNIESRVQDLGRTRNKNTFAGARSEANFFFQWKMSFQHEFESYEDITHT